MTSATLWAMVNGMTVQEWLFCIFVGVVVLILRR